MGIPVGSDSPYILVVGGNFARNYYVRNWGRSNRQAEYACPCGGVLCVLASRLLLPGYGPGHCRDDDHGPGDDQRRRLES